MTCLSKGPKLIGTRGLNKLSNEKGVLLSMSFPTHLAKEIQEIVPAHDKYHVPYLGYLAAASQPSFDTGNVPSTMRRNYFIKLCFREISTPHPVSSLHKAISLRSLYRGEF